MKEDEMGREYSMHGRDEKFVQFFYQKSGGKRLCGRPRCRWKDNIRMDHIEIGWECVDWIQLAQDGDHLLAPVNTVMKL
jgi:hypothetical protein